MNRVVSESKMSAFATDDIFVLLLYAAKCDRTFEGAPVENKGE